MLFLNFSWAIASILLISAYPLEGKAQNPVEQQTMTPAEIEARIRQEWLPRLPWESAEIERIDIPQTLVLPLGEVRLSITSAPRTDLCRPFFVRVDFQIDGRVARSAFYRTELGIYDTVPVAAKQLAFSENIDLTNVRWEKRRLASTLNKVVENAAFFEGKKPRTTIASGQILTEDLFVKAPIIKRGDVVVVVFEDGSIRVTTQGKSLATGAKGDHIRILNMDSKKELLAEIVDEKTVRVNF